ncbi:hypothetical protein F1880_008828 [Penicillium rolfsii]|nr:hypothetical protein F1880_008828 [Penicillium rolfsii]
MTRKRHVRRNRRLRYRPSEDRPPKKPKLSWDTYQQQVLCCLYRFFECSNDQLSALFSTTFRSHLRQYGYGDSDVPYRTLVSQWYWLRRQNRLVWHHVHVATAFRTDGEWKDIIHRIRMTAFELGILLNEKRFDTIAVPDDKFDVNKDPCEFLTSVLLSSSPTTQHPSSMKGSVDTGPEISTEDTRGSHGYFSGDLYLHSSAPSPVVIDGFPHGASSSISSEIPETPTPASNVPTLMTSTRLAYLQDDSLVTPTPQGLGIVDYLRSDTQMSHDSSQASKPLVTSNEKLCFWCFKEGIEHHSTPVAEPHFGLHEIREYDTQYTTDAFTPQSSSLDIREIASFNVDSERSNDFQHPTELPGCCAVDGLPPLLYRWSNTNSQGINTEMVLVAGWFTANYPDVGSPSQLSEIDFLNMFAAHVKRVQVPTPFISAFARPLAPIHRALRNRENAKLSVINPRKIPNPGYGEYAIWGYVPSEAIVCTFDIATLEDIAILDLEIQQFLQLSLIQMQETCHRRLRHELRVNLQARNYEENRSVLRRLAYKLGVPEEYQESFAKDVHEAWTKDLGPSYEDIDDSEGLDNPRNAPAPAPQPLVSDMVDWLNEESQRALRYNSESTTSYVPPKSDDGSCSESTSEEEDNLSQSPEAPCPRRDTPSPAFSVASESDDSVSVTIHRSRARVMEMTAVSAPPTPPSTSRYFSRSANVNVNARPPQSLALSRLNLSNSLNDDNYFSEGAEWPSDSDTLPGADTPTRSRFFSHNANSGDRGVALVSGLTVQGRNPFVIDDDELAGL